jgi:hypothetical protein
MGRKHQLMYHKIDKANVTADCLENRCAHHDLCDENNAQGMEAIVQVLLEAVNNPSKSVRPCDIQKKKKSKLTKIEKGPWNLRHSKRMPQVPSQNAVGVYYRFA